MHPGTETSNSMMWKQKHVNFGHNVKGANTSDLQVADSVTSTTAIPYSLTLEMSNIYYPYSSKILVVWGNLH